MKNLISITAAILILFVSCKKDGPGYSVKKTNVQILTTAPSSTLTTTVATYSALCSNQKVLIVHDKLSYLSYSVQNTAVFTNSLFTNFDLPAGYAQNAGTVSVNGKVLKSSSYIYNDSTYTYLTGPLTWNCTGSVVTTFSYTNPNEYPSYADYTAWPDTIKKGKIFTMYMKNVLNADEAQLIISHTGTVNPVTYTALVSAGSINVSTISLVPLYAGNSVNNGIIQCNFYKNNVQQIGGTKVNFRTVTSFVKNIKLVN